MFAYSPIAIANAPVRVDDAAGAEDLLLPLPGVDGADGLGHGVHRGQRRFLFQGSPRADRIAAAAAELTVVFGLFGLVSGSLWGRKAWGVWWQWDARLTMAFLLELIFFGYLLVRKLRRARLRETGGGDGHLRRRDGAVRLQVGGLVAHRPSEDQCHDDARPDLARNVVRVRFCTFTFLLFMGLLLAARIRLEEQRAALDQLYLAAED